MFVNMTAKIKEDGVMKIPLSVLKFLYTALKGCVQNLRVCIALI